MRPRDMKTLWRYVLGQASKAEAEAAFLESLREPRWMMSWFEQHHEKLSVLANWFRGSSQQMTALLKDIASRARAFRAVTSTKTIQRHLVSEERQSEMVLAVTNDLLARDHPDAPPCREIDRVYERCPGLTTAIQLMLSPLRDSLGDRPRDVLDSDFVDAIHAMYAPYVDVFRADRYMAPHIQRLVERWGTSVVARLEDLPDRIHELLAKESPPG